MVYPDLLIFILYLSVSIVYIHKVYTTLQYPDGIEELRKNVRYAIFVPLYFLISMVYLYKSVSE